MVAHNMLTSLKVATLDVQINEFFHPLTQSAYGPPLPTLKRLQLSNVNMQTFAQAITLLTQLTYLYMMPSAVWPQFQALHPGTTALQQLKELVCIGMKELNLDVSLLLALPRLKMLTIMRCKKLIVPDGMHKLANKHAALRDVCLRGTTFCSELQPHDHLWADYGLHPTSLS